MPTLAERLGYAPDAKLLIVNCDDLGSTRSAHVAIYEALRHGFAIRSLFDGVTDGPLERTQRFFFVFPSTCLRR